MSTPYTGWQNIQTIQSKEILFELSSAKETQKALLLISDTGLGKSNTIKLFNSKNSDHNYIVVVGDSYNVNDVVHDLLRQVGITHWTNRVTPREKLVMIAEKMADIRQAGGKPMIIVDEAENLKPQTLKRIKELYDAVIEHCSLTLIGTQQILEGIHNTKNKNRQSVPQLWRRFKAGVREITKLNKARDFTPFFQLYIPGNLDLQDLLIELCDNYGELHDYLDPVLRYSAAKNAPVTEELLRLIHKLPSKRKR